VVRSEEQVEQFKKSILNSLPLGRVGNPDEIAKAVAFLSSNDCIDILKLIEINLSTVQRLISVYVESISNLDIAIFQVPLLLPLRTRYDTKSLLTYPYVF
jgi:hypothetical protein